MRVFRDPRQALIETDGACIDVNFVGPTWKGVAALLNNLLASYSDVTASDGNGDVLEIGSDSLASAAKSGAWLHLVMNNGAGLVRKLQAFISPEPDGSPFVELTFFPEDIHASADLVEEFLVWADGMLLALRAKSYFARHENASWEFGDVGPASGVFLASS